MIPLTTEEQKIVDDFFKLFERKGCQRFNTWRGVVMIKTPFDQARYHQIIHDTRPDVIVECGTFNGGSALFFLDTMKICGIDGLVLSIDRSIFARRPREAGIEYISSNTINRGTVAQIAKRVTGKRVMVVLDSDHHKDHVLREIWLYKDLVSSGCYMVVEDGCVNNNPVFPDYGPGPSEAITEFMKTNNEFIQDKDIEDLFLLTYHPKGWLKKK